MLSAFQQSEKGMIETTKLLNEMRAERASGICAFSRHA
jgi:hypothetical protein